MTLFPKSPDEQNKALLRMLTFLESIAISLYVLAVLRRHGQFHEFYEPLKFVAGGFAIVLGLVIWAFCAVRCFISKRYGRASAFLVVGIVQTIIFIKFAQLESQVKVRAVTLADAPMRVSNQTASGNVAITSCSIAKSFGRAVSEQVRWAGFSKR